MPQKLAGKVAIITGGVKGLGRAAVELFLDEGAKVVVADVDPEGEKLAASLGGHARFKRTDISDPEAVQTLVDYTVSEFGGLHVMYNNAGVSYPIARLLDDSVADFDNVMRINVLGCMLGTQRTARYMVKHGGRSDKPCRALAPGASGSR